MPRRDGRLQFLENDRKVLGLTSNLSSDRENEALRSGAWSGFWRLRHVAAHVTCAPQGFRLGVGHRELREECAQWGGGCCHSRKAALGRSGPLPATWGLANRDPPTPASPGRFGRGCQGEDRNRERSSPGGAIPPACGRD